MGPSADMDGDGMPECYTDISDPGTLIAGCVPLNFFGGGSVVRETGEVTVATLTQDMLDYVHVTLTNHRQWDASSFGANLTGNVFNLPGGPLGWAAGYGYWKQEFRYSPDSAVAGGTVTGNTGAGTEGSLTNNSVYLEGLAPLWDNGTQDFYLKGGLRYDDWNAFDGDWTWQLGLEFQALDSLKLRGTAGTVFRVPTILDLYRGQYDDFPTANDPCVPRGGEPIAPGCAQEGVQLDTQVLAKVGGNPNG